MTGYQSPDVLRRRGQARLSAWLRKRDVRRADQVAAAALEAAAAQHATLPGQMVAGQITADLAGQVLAVDDRLARVDQQIKTVFAQHPQADIITSMPGVGTVLGAEFVVAAGDLSVYSDAGRLASRPGWSRCLATPVVGPGTCTGPGGTADACGACSTSRRRPASSAKGPVATSTSRSAARDFDTSKLSSPSPGDESTSSGTPARQPPVHRRATLHRSRRPSPLDKHH